MVSIRIRLEQIGLLRRQVPRQRGLPPPFFTEIGKVSTRQANINKGSDDEFETRDFYLACFQRYT
jgi:hypothetical protein